MTKLIFYCNPNTISCTSKFALFDHATEIRIDAISLVWLMNAYNLLLNFCSDTPRKKISRRSFDFTSDASSLLKDWEHSSDQVFFIGGTKSDSEKFRNCIHQSYPKLKVHTYDGYAQSSQRDLADHLTKRSKLVVGLGTPLQESLAISLAQLNICSEIYTCGAFISQTAESDGQYYPYFINKFHLRWLWRALREPHVIKRLLFSYPKGFYLSFKFYLIFRDKIH